MDGFHPAIYDWFKRRYGTPTSPQEQAWPFIQQGRPVLIAAPTGSGKTLAAFLSAIDGLVRDSQEAPLPAETHVLYVSPLKALSSDIAKNLEEPLAQISEELRARELTSPDIRVAVRTGDTSPKDRARAIKSPPHIQVTTPESLYILLTSDGGRRMLSTVRTVIVDEIHAIVRDKRGAHLALSLERLDALVEATTGKKPQRIGLSATQKPIEEVARFLVGSPTERGCVIIDSGHRRELDLSLMIPPSPLGALLSLEEWQGIYDQLAELVREHKTTLIFVNTRRIAERATRYLTERLGADAVTSHHGSLSRELRLDAETRLKSGRLRALVATASLELGIDVGDVELVCQLGSPRSIATFLQRVGRSGHFVGGTPKGRLFPLSRDDLVECTALLDAVERGELDRLTIRRAPLDVLAQQIVASLVPEDLTEDVLFERVRQAYPYQQLERSTFDEVVSMLAQGFATSRGRRGAYLHHDTVGHRLSARRGAKLAAITSGGAIPDNFDYDVLLQPTDVRIGSVHEDFAIESLVGDIFQLGNTSYQIQRIEAGVVRVSDAGGAPPTIPFWIGEAEPRTSELSFAVSRLRAWVSEGGDAQELIDELARRLRIPEGAAAQVVEYLLATEQALGVMPTQNTLVAERFFDETSGMHVVLHAPFGSRFNRAFGLALRKRFCRSFNVELQAAAGEDALLLSLGPMHSFPLETIYDYVRSGSAREVLTQALLDAPLFQTRWRWNASRALAVLRFRGGKKVPPRFQRMDADDLLALCFPDQVACLENIAGDREIPDHPLVNQTIEDCLQEAMDLDELLHVLHGIESGQITCVARDVTEPSPLAHEILNARPYAFLDDAPLEERRTQAVRLRRWGSLTQVEDLGCLDPAAITQITEELWPDPRTPDELHDALTVYGFLTESEGRQMETAHGGSLFEPLREAGRATRIEIFTQDAAPHFLWVARERLHEIRAVHPKARLTPPIHGALTEPEPTSALVELIRGRLELLGPSTTQELAKASALPEPEIQLALLTLEGEGFLLRGSFRPQSTEEFCERRILARIHRLTLGRLRREIEPVSPAIFLDFLFHWQGVHPETQREGPEGLFSVIEQLQGYPILAPAWESALLPSRVRNYEPQHLDMLCLSGRVSWSAPIRDHAGSLKTTPIRLFPRLHSFEDSSEISPSSFESWSADARRLFELLQIRGASFFSDLQRQSGLLPSQAENAFRELVARGLITTDSFSGLRGSLQPVATKGRPGARRNRRGAPPGIEAAGRISSLIHRSDPSPPDSSSAERDAERLFDIAHLLLRRWGVIFRQLLDRETGLPPWRELLRALHRLEARGEIRGGRFVTGFSGEQFALPEAVTALRKRRSQGTSVELIRLSALDPLNLTGILLPGERIASQASTQILWQGGLPVACSERGRPRLLQTNSITSEAELLAELRRPTERRALLSLTPNARRAPALPGNLPPS